MSEYQLVKVSMKDKGFLFDLHKKHLVILLMKYGVGMRSFKRNILTSILD